MPRVVDHEERRRAIAEAIFRVIGRDGMDAVSLRDVASEADVSMGAVQHYFNTKDEMLLFALEHMRQRVLARFTARIARLRTPTSKEYLRTVLRILLPSDQQSREEAMVNISFFASSVNHEQFRELLREGYANLLAVTEAQLAAAQQSGQLRPGVDVKNEAAALFYATQGLVGPILLGVVSARKAVSILDHQLDRLFRY